MKRGKNNGEVSGELVSMRRFWQWGGKIKMSIKNTKMIISIGVLAVAFSIGYCLFFGNPIDKYKARIRAEKYLADKYRNVEFKIKNLKYDFIYGKYYGEVIFEKQKDLPFTVSITKSGIYDDYEDIKYRLKKEQYKREIIEPIIKNQVNEVKGIIIGSPSSINADLKSKDINTADVNWDISIYYQENAFSSWEEFTNKCIQVKNILMENNILFSRIGFTYGDSNSVIELVINGDNSKMLTQQLIEQIRVIKSKE
ncbi:MAG: hypothetical protein JG777_2927 [Clostridia bacterium]|jgi:hypothetical protein|nr:hypothetical protein [Clostridia bacterium]